MFISGYRMDLDVDRLGYKSFKLQCFVRSYDRYDDIYEYCRAHPHITCFIRQLGDAKIELELDATGFAHCQEIAADFRAIFSGSLRTVQMKRQHYLWLPPSNEEARH
jgi:hypothetical protein